MTMNLLRKRNRMNINLQKHQQQYKEVNTNDTNI